MSNRLKEIQQPIQSELAEFEVRFRQSMKSKVALLDTIMTYIVKRKGKQMRPMFVLLSARLFGEINERSYRGASLVELLHTATLVHDDVVDDADRRRGFFSINALWKNKVAVLVGDYLLSKGLLLALKNKDFDMLEILSTAVEEMSEGELLQMEKARKLDITEEVYFDIISKKTASLIASCCAIGAASANQPEKVINQMHAFGLSAGIAFQIKDDLLDFGGDDIGKPTGIDIIEKKMTLPLIHALQQADRSERKRIIKIVRSDKKKKAEVMQVVDFVRKHGGIKYAHQHLIAYREKAIGILKEMEHTGDPHYLEALVEFVIDRNK
ncbi:MAG: polyprenyl synthetase family protein [Flavobacteriales bacterium]|nr:polyprenyl synthetase family protein [Bacteroidota bacterium]MCB9240778.1 polyprenyl synthetase family protein [Flavobacteriales bacterium]